MARTSRAKFTPFPRTRSIKNQPMIDIIRMKSMYVEGNDYSWAGFCKTNNFNPLLRKSLHERIGDEGGWKEWKRQWQKRQLGIYDEESLPEIISTKKLITLQRISFVKDWINRSKYLKMLFDAVLEKHGEALRHDKINTLAIQAGTVKPRFILSVEELRDIASTAAQLQSVDARSLLFVENAADHVKESDEDVSDEEREIEVSTMGAQNMTSNETIELIVNYYDQFQAKAKPAQVTSEENPQV